MKNIETIKLFLLSMFMLFIGTELVHSQIQTPRNNNGRGTGVWGNSNRDLKKGALDGNRWYWGGSLGANIGNTTFIDVSPLIGYRITEAFSIGAGYTFNYISGNGQSVTLNGLRSLARYDVLPTLFLQAEVEGLRYTFNGQEGQFVTRLPVGGGYRQRMGGNSFFVIEALYDLLYDEADNLYPNPLILRMGGTIGF